MNVTLTQRDVFAILNKADQEGVPYIFERAPDRASSMGTTLRLNSGDWNGPGIDITLLNNGTWMATATGYLSPGGTA